MNGSNLIWSLISLQTESSKLSIPVRCTPAGSTFRRFGGSSRCCYADAAGPAGAGAHPGAGDLGAAMTFAAAADAALKTALATVIRGALHPAKCCHQNFAASFASCSNSMQVWLQVLWVQHSLPVLGSHERY